MITIATLKAAGLTAEQIVAVLESAENDRLAKRREQNRVNQANKRERDRHHVSADAADSADTSSALTYLLTSPESKKEERKEERAKRESRRVRGHICPDDFRPSEVHFEAGLKRGMGRERVEACSGAMRSWSKANSHRAVARKVDWSAALFNWIETEANRNGKANGHGNIKDAFAELRLELGSAGDGGEGGPPMRDVTPNRAGAG